MRSFKIDLFTLHVFVCSVFWLACIVFWFTICFSYIVKPVRLSLVD